MSCLFFEKLYHNEASSCLKQTKKQQQPCGQTNKIHLKGKQNCLA